MTLADAIGWSVRRLLEAIAALMGRESAARLTNPSLREAPSPVVRRMPPRQIRMRTAHAPTKTREVEREAPSPVGAPPVPARGAKARTIRVNRIGKTDLRVGLLVYPEPVDHPKTRGECKGGVRPCPYVSCRHHLYLDVDEDSGNIKVNRPDVEVWDLVHSCSLDLAELAPVGQTGVGRGDHMSLDAVGALFGISKERVRQIEMPALAKLQRRLRRVEIEEFAAPRVSMWDLAMAGVG